LYCDDLQQFDSSPQAKALLADMSKHRDSLRSAGIHFGTSRLAVEPQGGDGRPGCAYCGLCMYGCPYELIYSTDVTLQKLLKDKNFTYVKNVLVAQVQEKNGAATVIGSDRLTGAPLRYEGDRVCLAAGPLATTRILLESMQAYNQPIEMCDSQIFLAPLLRYWKAGRASSHSLHTLSQLFIEILDSAIVPYTSQLQVYTYNDLYVGAMKHMLGPLYPLFKFPLGEVLDRMLVLFGYIHSDYSPKMRIVLDRPSDGNRGLLHLSVAPREVNTRAIIRRVLKKMWRNRKYLRGIPLTPMLNVTPTGRSFHSGGTFPMSANPTGFQSDTLGRPHGFSRVHAVDSTIFPSIPATTITLTIMANAHRIGSALASL
jgi:choline dehydrogenase-like flavoprotein